jgi:aminoglycoside phosphotransferase family enzyme
MRRLPVTSMLSVALTTGRCLPRDLDRVIARLVDFYGHAASQGIREHAYRDRLSAEVRRNRDALRTLGRRLEQPLVRAACDAQERFIKLHAAALGARGAHVIEGHGDLRAEHVCLEPDVCVIDCLEFSRDLRLLDPAHDLAALALDSARLGRQRLALELLQRYRQASGDAIADGLLLFYLGLCAVTHAKIAAWHVGDRQFPNARPWLRRTNSYLRDAVRYTRLALKANASPTPVASGRVDLRAAIPSADAR